MDTNRLEYRDRALSAPLSLLRLTEVDAMLQLLTRSPRFNLSDLVN
ncbi:hypothetical protein H6F90_10115 [Trichocoleus sp. FACHB-591]|nr:hypothetical protein [Trichocoleus sp. FACHB-591]MBD2095514.1 hypothetical protein [Trichocoleus sp. FACHB-591]